MRRFLHDLARVVILIILVGMALYWADPANSVVFQALGIGVFLVGGTHLTRRIMMPKLDLQSIALKAVEDANFPAALVFCGVIYFLIPVMDLSMRVFK